MEAGYSKSLFSVSPEKIPPGSLPGALSLDVRVGGTWLGKRERDLTVQYSDFYLVLWLSVQCSYPPSVVTPGVSWYNYSCSYCVTPVWSASPKSITTDVCTDQGRRGGRAVSGASRLMEGDGARPNWAFYRFSISPIAISPAPDLRGTWFPSF